MKINTIANMLVTVEREPVQDVESSVSRVCDRQAVVGTDHDVIARIGKAPVPFVLLKNFWAFKMSIATKLRIFKGGPALLLKCHYDQNCDSQI